MTIGDSTIRDIHEERNRPARLEEEIRRLAYQIWEDRGRGEGEALRDWLQAEEEILSHRATRQVKPRRASNPKRA